MAFRIPAGVRLAGKGIGGRFVALADIPTLAAALEGRSREKLQKRLATESRKATRRLAAAAESEQRAEESGRGFTKRRAVRKQAQERARSLRAVEDATRAATTKAKQREQEAADDSEAAAEWAIGASYEPASGRQGRRTSAVDVSILVRRIDGVPMRQSEAKRVLTYVREHRLVPVDYYLAAIDWRSPKSGNGNKRDFKGWQTGNVEGDFDNFYNVLTAVSGKPGRWTVKMGGLK